MKRAEPMNSPATMDDAYKSGGVVTAMMTVVIAVTNRIARRLLAQKRILSARIMFALPPNGSATAKWTATMVPTKG